MCTFSPFAGCVCTTVQFFFSCVCLCVCLCDFFPSPQCILTWDKLVVCHFQNPAGQVRHQPTEVQRKVMKEEENGGKINRRKVLRDPSDPQRVLIYWPNLHGQISHTLSLCCALIMVLGLVSELSVF